MLQKRLTWLLPLLTLGLSGAILLRRRPGSSRTAAFNLIDQTKWKPIKKYIIAQSKVESANYTSDLFNRSNNAFGMKNAKSRDQLGFSVPGDQYRNYSSLNESVEDFIYYLNYVKFPSMVYSPEEYARKLKDLGYYESNQVDYANALKSWL